MTLKPDYVYAIICPVTGAHVYIGRTYNLNERFKQHKNGYLNISRWIRAMISIGYVPYIKPIDVNYTGAKAMESLYIKYFRSIGQANFNVSEVSKSDCSKRCCSKKPDNCQNIINEKEYMLKEIYALCHSYKYHSAIISYHSIKTAHRLLTKNTI